jgi:hypothetical protein
LILIWFAGCGELRAYAQITQKSAGKQELPAGLLTSALNYALIPLDKNFFLIQ